MKAEVIRWNNSLDRYTIKIINGISYGRMSKEKAQKIAGKLNSALASHVQSELSTKIAAIENEFTDRKVRPLDPVWVKNEILKLLKGE